MNPQMTNPSSLNPGDIITRQQDDGLWSVVKVLAIDLYPDGESTVHSLCYQPTSSKPSLDTLIDQPIMTMHAPIDGASLTPEERWELIDTVPLIKGEHDGFFEYLRRTDFRRYTEATGQDMATILDEANQLYKEGLSVYARGEHEAAIEIYSKAIDKYPQFHEALDERGFIYMDIGDYTAAQQDFDLSLFANPQGLTAYLSKGECLVQMGQKVQAAELYRKGIERFPNKAALFKTYYDKLQ